MIKINTNKALINANKLQNVSNSRDIFVKAFCKILKIEKNNWKRKSAFVAIEFVVALLFAMQSTTIPLAKEAFQIFLSVNLALLAILFTGYSIFQTLINDKLLEVLLSVDKGDLSETNRYFAEVMFFQIGCLIINICIMLFCIAFPEDWCLLYSDAANTILASVVILILLHINFEGIWEMKSFIKFFYKNFHLKNIVKRNFYDLCCKNKF